MAAEVKEDPEAGLVGADGDGEWMEELLQGDGSDIPFGVDLGDFPSSVEYMPPWPTPLSSTLDQAGSGDHSLTPEEDLWGLRNDSSLAAADLDGMLQVLASSPTEERGLPDPSAGGGCLLEETCRVDVHESQESNRVQDSADSTQGNSSRPRVKVESPASSYGNSGAKGPMKEKESDSDSDNCAGKRPVVEQEEVEKLQERLMRNRESAQLSRQRRKAYMEEMATRIRTLSTTVSELNATIAHLSAENAGLRHQLAFYLPPGTAPPLPAIAPPYMPQAVPGMRPLYPAPGPIPYGAYPGVMRPGYVPPVPIPRLPVQSAASTKKATTKRGPSTRGKAKDVSTGANPPAKKRTKLPAKAAAGISAMALFCFAMVLAPASWHATDISASSALQPAGFEGFGVKTGGRVLMSLPEGNESLQTGGLDLGGKAGELDLGGGRGGGFGGRERGGEGVKNGLVNSSLVWQQLVNASSPFSAPVSDHRKNKAESWVLSEGGVEDRSKVPVIRGSLGGDWIKGVVIAEAQKAAQRIVSDVVLRKGSEASRVALMTGSREHERLKGIATLALAGRAERTRHAALPAAGGEKSSEYRPATLLDKDSAYSRGSPEYGRFSERQTSDAWTLGGAPFLSSGMCTELFQFSDAVVVGGSSDAGARMAAEKAALAVAQGEGEVKQGGAQQNQTTSLRGMGRKWKPKDSEAVLMPPVNTNGSHFEAEAEFEEVKRCKDNAFGCRNESSSVVVSVMVPQVGWERATFEHTKGASTAGKGLSQIFVVVLINSAKYVTYSCSVPSVA